MSSSNKPDASGANKAGASDTEAPARVEAEPNPSEAESNPPAAEPNPWIAGLLCKCPRCGKGPVFAGFLRIADECSVCGQDFRNADSGDGPAVFVILIGGALVVPFALWIEFAFHPPAWVHMMLSLPMALIVCVGLLRPFKSLLYALQHAHKAHEIRPEDWDK